jgi:hypothetical protein
MEGKKIFCHSPKNHSHGFIIRRESLSLQNLDYHGFLACAALDTIRKQIDESKNRRKKILHSKMAIHFDKISSFFDIIDLCAFLSLVSVAAAMTCFFSSLSTVTSSHT